MSDLDKGKGNLGPAPREPEKRQSEVDKDKFKDLMGKVEESDEAEKRDKRRTKGGRKEDEDDEVDVEENAPAPTGDFSAYMGGDDEKSSLFDVKSGGTLSTEEPQEPPESGNFLYQPQGYEDRSPPPDDSGGLHDSFYMPKPQPEQQAPPPSEPQPEEAPQQQPQEVQGSQQPQQQQQDKKKDHHDESLLKATPDRFTSEKKKGFKVEKEHKERVPTLDPSSDEHKKILTGKKEPTHTEHKKEPEKSPEPQKQTTKEGEIQQAPMRAKTEHEMKKQDASEPRKVEVQEQITSMTTPHKGEEKGDQKGQGDDHKKASSIEATEEAGEAGLGAQVAKAPFPKVEPTELPKYATLNEHIFEMFEKLSGVMIVMSMKEGEKTTHVSLNMENSPFNGSEIEIKEFDIARGVFNVQLIGSPEAVDLFNANIDDLAAAFQQANYSFKVNVQRPILKSTETYARVERKEEGSGGQNDGQK